MSGGSDSALGRPAQQLDAWLTNTQRIARTGSSHPTLATGTTDDVGAHLESIVTSSAQAVAETSRSAAEIGHQGQSAAQTASTDGRHRRPDRRDRVAGFR